MKKILILFMFVLSAQLIYAQSGMTDEQIVEFIISEQEKGSDDRTIGAKLLQKGVKEEQLRRIQRRFKAQETQLGAVDLVGKGSKRLRDKNKSKDAKSEQVNNLYSSEMDNTSRKKRSTAQDELDLLAIDTLIYYQNLLKESQQAVYGRNIFNNELLTFEPSLNIPIPANYVLGAGDQVIIDVWGTSQSVVDDVISPDGNIVIDGVGLVYLAGKTVSEANEYVKSILGNIYADSNINLTVGMVRSIQVQVLGEVVTPGNYTISALSTAFNALYAAGGINDFGTLRNIKVYRGGKLISTIDVYKYIQQGDVSGDVRLQDNDVINVGAYDAIVNIQGKVKRPMFYELKSDENLSTLLNYSGGFTGDAYRENIRVVRKSGREYSLHTVERTAMGQFLMNDGDSVYIDSIIPRFSNMVEISGAVFYPGQYQLGDRVKTVKQLIEIAGGVREDAFLNRAVLHHNNYDNTIEAQALDIKGILDGTLEDIPLRSNDIIFIPSRSEMDGELTVKIGGEVRYGGIFKYAENTTLEDIILQAGGLTRDASFVKVDVFRPLYNPKALKEEEQTSHVYSFEIKDGFVVDGEQDFVLEPYDEVYVRRSPLKSARQNVTVRGAVNFEGDYAIVNKNYRLSDLVSAAGGLSLSAYPNGASLTRKMTEEELAARDVLVNTSQIEIYEEAMRSEKDVNLDMLDSLYKAKLNLGTSYSVAINLVEALENPGGPEDILLREGDVLSLPQFTSTVKISGEVRHPISINWRESEKLKYYIEHAGGYSDAAKKNGVYVIYMNGSVEKISKYSKTAIQPGCEIVVPRKSDRRLSNAELLSLGTSAVSISSMIIMLINALK